MLYLNFFVKVTILCVYIITQSLLSGNNKVHSTSLKDFLTVIKEQVTLLFQLNDFRPRFSLLILFLKVKDINMIALLKHKTKVKTRRMCTKFGFELTCVNELFLNKNEIYQKLKDLFKAI